MEQKSEHTALFISDLFRIFRSHGFELTVNEVIFIYNELNKRNLIENYQGIRAEFILGTSEVLSEILTERQNVVFSNVSEIESKINQFINKSIERYLIGAEN